MPFQLSRPESGIVVEDSEKETAALSLTQEPSPGRREARREVLPAAQWLRVVVGFEAPFGHDGLPTVWG